MTNNQIARFLKICDDYDLGYQSFNEDPFLRQNTPDKKIPKLEDFSFGFNVNDVFCYAADFECVETDEDLDLLEATCQEIDTFNLEEMVIPPFYADILYTARKHKIIPTEKYITQLKERKNTKLFIELLEKAARP